MTSTDTRAEQDGLRQQARRSLETGQWDAAQAAFEELARRAPHDVAIRMELADVTLRRGYMRAATSQLLQAQAMLGNDAPMIAQLAWRLSATGETSAVRACADHLERAPDPPGWLLAEQAHLRWMLAISPALAPGWIWRWQPASMRRPSTTSTRRCCSSPVGSSRRRRCCWKPCGDGPLTATPRSSWSTCAAIPPPRTIASCCRSVWADFRKTTPIRAGH